MGEQLMDDEHLSDEWLVIHTPDGNRSWNLGHQVRDDHEREDLITRARVVAGAPAHNNWVSDGSGWMVSLQFGDPPPTVGTVGTLDELANIDPDKVTEYQADIAEATRAASVAAAAAYLAGLDPTLLAAVMAHPHVLAAVKATS